MPQGVEKLNFLTYASLLIGFLGVLFVVQPGFESFNIYYLIVLVGVFLITVTTFIVNKYSNVTTNVGYFLYGGIFAHLIFPLCILFYFSGEHTLLLAITILIFINLYVILVF